MNSKQTYEVMFDLLLSEELSFNSSSATEHNIKTSMKRILGRAIKQGLLRSYSGLVLDEDLNVHFSMVDADKTEFSLILYYGK
jgi:hypothetical protein